MLCGRTDVRQSYRIPPYLVSQSHRIANPTGEGLDSKTPGYPQRFDS